MGGLKGSWTEYISFLLLPLQKSFQARNVEPNRRINKEAETLTYKYSLITKNFIHTNNYLAVQPKLRKRAQLQVWNI